MLRTATRVSVSVQHPLYGTWNTLSPMSNGLKTPFFMSELTSLIVTTDLHGDLQTHPTFLLSVRPPNETRQNLFFTTGNHFLISGRNCFLRGSPGLDCRSVCLVSGWWVSVREERSGY